MRLWHKDLIPFLPRQQLLAQWRECCLIAKNIAEKGTPNHILVNRIMDYPLEHFLYYGRLIHADMTCRGFKADWDKFDKWFRNKGVVPYSHPKFEDLFSHWHNDRYLLQCFYNLQEKYECGGIAKEEWKPINDYI